MNFLVNRYHFFSSDGRRINILNAISPYTLIFYFIIHFSSVAYGQDLGKDWQLVRDENSVKIWKLYSNSEVIGTLHSNGRAKPLSWNRIKKEGFIKNLEKNKMNMLSLIGIKEWKTKKYVWSNATEEPELSAIGTYKDSSGKTIEFQELHVFKAKETIQILYTQPFDAVINPKLWKDFFLNIKKFVGNK